MRAESMGAKAFLKAVSEPTVAADQRVKLLLVDDNEENLVALEAALAVLGEETYSARSGQDALRLCLEHDFGAILLDVRMPDLDGFETARLIRARPRSRHTPILFLTAYRSDEHLFRGYDLGAVDFLFKPIVPEILQSKVAVFVELSRRAELLKQQAASLERAQSQLRAVIEAAPDAMLITDRQGQVLLVNSRVEELFGYSRAELSGANISRLVPGWSSPETPPADGEDDDDAPAEPSRRLIAVRKNHTEFPADLTLSAFRSENSWLVTTAVRDMTESFRAQQHLEQMNLALEAMVAERTAELTRSNSALRQFAWATSHDLQEPLRTIITYAQYLSRHAGDLNPKNREVLRFIEEGASRMDRLLASLRQFLLVNETAIQKLDEVDCGKVVREVLRNLSTLVEESRAIVECDDLPSLRSVEVLVAQVLQNLIGNAMKYRGPRRPSVRVQARRQDNEWIFSVSDNGVGIDPKYRDYIFGEFKRLQRDGGAGMGLAICKAAVERLGGRIWVESVLGEGSTFYFSLPDDTRAPA
ncbi:MAG: response regulator [Bryobacteraceae bacterium]|nr:response regulator [Bryobacteraceae bacterium]